MKTLRLGLIVSTFAFICCFQSAFGQCVLNPTACTPTDPSLPACIDPDVGDAGVVGTPYDFDIQINFGLKAKAGPLEVWLAKLEVIEVKNIPEGLSLAITSSNANDDINGKDKGTIWPKDNKTPMYACGKFTGTPTKANQNTDSLTIVARIFVKLTETGAPVDPNSLGQNVNPIEFNYHIPIGLSSRSTSNDQALNFRMYPNPAEAQTTLTYNLPETSDVTVEIVNINGAVVYRTHSTAQSVGMHNIEISTEQLPKGLYIVNLRANNQILSQKLVK